MERLATGDSPPTGAFRSIVDGWVFALEQDVLAEGTAESGEAPQLIERTNALMEQRLAEITKQAPAFAATLRAYRLALASNDAALADGLLAWLTSPRYARVHHDELTARVLDLMAQHPAWRLPLGYKDGEYGAERVPSGAYREDRDMFLFLCARQTGMVS